MKIFFSICVAAILLVAFGFLNIARFTSAEGELESGTDFLKKYADRNAEKYDCVMSLDPGYPHRWPSRAEDLLGMQIVWSFSWRCDSPGDRVAGDYIVYSDGNSVIYGVSETHGSYGTSEY